ncbi:MAG TPA: endonuclease/exonuclease/phosphatase family protein [Acetobacteraceae bacterium]|nr:endonuclease/exonuclease/phosphatase family protein [Acetobacteraceae bacterium]
MRLLAWNIRQGGGTRLAGIVAALLRHDADVLILSEYRGGDSADRLRAALKVAGYRHVSELMPPPGRTGVLIAARRGFATHGALYADVPEPYRLVDVDCDAVRITGVYMPNMLKKVPYWQALVASFAARVADDTLAIGDFNTCRAFVDEPGAIDATAHFMDSVEAIGFRDLWRQRYPEGREYSWYSHRGNGFRIDHAFLSPGLAARAGAVRYSHGERLAGLSDHSVLLLDLPKRVRRSPQPSPAQRARVRVEALPQQPSHPGNPPP